MPVWTSAANLERGDQPITGRRVIAKNDVARLFTTAIAAEAPHLFDDMTVADLAAVMRDFEPQDNAQA